MAKILLVGYKGKKSHLTQAIEKGHSFDLLIQENAYVQGYEEVFDQVFTVQSIVDYAEVITAFESGNIPNTYYDAVLTRYEEFVEITLLLQHHFNLPHTPTDKIEAFRNKAQMKTVFMSQDIPCAQGKVVQSVTEAKEYAPTIGFPLILKQVAGQGSSLVSEIHAPEEVEKRFMVALKSFERSDSFVHDSVINCPFYNPRSKQTLLMEEMMYGQEYSIDSFVTKNGIVHTPIFQYVLAKDLGIDDSHLAIRFTPINSLSESDIAHVHQVVEKTIAAMETINVTTHAEFFFDNKTHTCKVVEIAARTGGMRGEMIQQSTGSDFDMAVINTALGITPTQTFVPKKTIGTVYIHSLKTGILKDFDLSVLEKYPYIYHSKIYKIGNRVGLAKNGNKAILRVILETDSPEELITIAK